MITEMHAHTRRQAIRLGLVMALFLILASSLAILLRYRQMLETALDQHGTIRRNLTQMRLETTAIRDVIASFRRLLPNGHGKHSAELLLYSRLDDIKSRLPAGEMVVRTPETKEGVLTLEFAFKPATAVSYSAMINTLGLLEQQIDPFVSINKVSLEGSTKEKPGPLTIAVDGVLTTRFGSDEAGERSAPAPVPPPPPGEGREKP